MTGRQQSASSRGIIENAPATSGSGTTSPDLPYTTVKVFYATDRKEGDGKKPASSYGGDRGTITYGTCDVTVPKDHRVGEIESPSFIRLEFSENPAKHVILANVEKQSATDFYRDVGTKVAASKGKSAFIFVHGYNVTFEDAARRTAQMSYDLKFDGAPVFFSWPSQGTYLGYTVDEFEHRVRPLGSQEIHHRVRPHLKRRADLSRRPQHGKSCAHDGGGRRVSRGS